MDGVDDGAGVSERAARAGAVLATDPTGVDEPAVGVGTAHSLGKHVSVSRRLSEKEKEGVRDELNARSEPDRGNSREGR